MADLVVGMAKTVVEGVVTKAQAAVEEEAKLRQSAQRDLVFITGEFQMMQAFLQVANEERVENPVVITWVRQIRDLAYDVEDCIEFVVHLDKKSRWWWRMIPSWCMATRLPLDEAVDEIQQLKARVEDVSTRNTRYSLISDTGAKPTVVVQQQPAAAFGATAFNMLVAPTTTGKMQRGDLTHLLTNGDPDLQVISVCGTGGDLGIASIIWRAYNDQQIREKFKCRAWVKITHPFNPQEFVRCLVAEFQGSSSSQEPQGPVQAAHVKKIMEANHGDQFEFVRHVNTKRYLIVLEDLSTVAEWAAIRAFFPNIQNHSRIILATQQLDVAILSVGNSYQVWDLHQFSADHSVYAFSQEGSQGDDMGVADNGSSSNDETKWETILDSKKANATTLIGSATVIGRDLEMIDLRKNINESGYKVMSVWGISGVGKSALIRSLFHDRILYSEVNIFNKYGWVDVSHPLNLRDFSRSLLWNMHSKSIDTVENEYHFMMRNNNPIQECQAHLKRGHCLIVIDDVQSKHEWNLIQDYLVPISSNNVIIVITTEESIAAYCADKEVFVFNIKSLEANAASTLFKKVAGKDSFPSGREAELQELTWKCGGLPKIIVAVGSLLSTKTVTWMETARSINLSFIHELETNRGCDGLRDLFSWLDSYFRLCPDFLKPCIFYLSLFPRGRSIRRRRLVRRWIAEGYARDSEDKSAEQNGEAFFNNLLSLSIIQQPPEKAVTTSLGQTRMVWCQVNGFIREYIVSRRMDENLVFELEGNCIPTTQRAGRHLVVGDSWDRDKIVFKSIDVSRLRSLTVFGEWRPFLVSDNMKLLRVLDLEDAVGIKDEDVYKIVKRMHSLKFLSLRGCHDVSYLPCSLGDLRQLQSLDIRGTSIDTLPESITKLDKLQYIRAGTTAPASVLCTSACSRLSELCCRRCNRVGVRLPEGVRKLKALRTLGVVNVSCSWSKVVMVKELRKITQLCKLGVSGINRKNSDKFLTAIKGNVHLESLSIRLDKGNQDCLDGMSQILELKNLQSLKLYGIKDKLPLSDVQLDKITKLVLEMDILTEHVIRSLGDLPRLSILRLRVNKLQTDQVGKIPFVKLSNSYENISYEKVKILEIACSSRLPVTFGLGTKTMQNLELLKVDCCNGSQYEFSGLENLSELKEVFIVKGTNHDILKQNIESMLANHPKRPSVKLEEPRST